MSQDADATPETDSSDTSSDTGGTPDLDGGIPDELLPDDVRPTDDNPLAKGPTEEDEDPDAGFSPDAAATAPGD